MKTQLFKSKNFITEETQLLVKFNKMRDDYIFLLNVYPHYFKYSGRAHTEFESLCLRSLPSKVAFKLFNKPMLDYGSDAELARNIREFHENRKNILDQHESKNQIVGGTWEETLKKAHCNHLKVSYRYNHALLVTKTMVSFAVLTCIALCCLDLVGIPLAANIFIATLSTGIMIDIFINMFYFNSTKLDHDKKKMKDNINETIDRLNLSFKDFMTSDNLSNFSMRPYEEENLYENQGNITVIHNPPPSLLSA